MSMSSTTTVGFSISGKTLEELEANADAAAKELANGRSYTFEVAHVHGSFEPDLGKQERPRPSRFSASVTAWLDGPPPSFTDDRRRPDLAW